MTDPRDEKTAVPAPSARVIIEEVALKYYLWPVDLRGPSRAWRVTRPRHEAMHAIRQRIPGMSLAAIGRVFGGRDHKTVLEGIRSHEARLKEAGHGG